MTLAEIILRRLQSMPESLQAEVLDFVEYLESKANKCTSTEDEFDWSDLSLSFAMRGMEDEDTPYSVHDLKDVFS